MDVAGEGNRAAIAVAGVGLSRRRKLVADAVLAVVGQNGELADAVCEP